MVTVGGSHPGAHRDGTGAAGWAGHWPFPQADRGVGASSPLNAHGIPILISHWHLLPQSPQCRAPDPAPGGPVKVQSKASVKAPSLVGVICFLLNLSIFSRK